MLYFSTRRPRHTAFDRRAGGFIRFDQSTSRRSFVQRRPIADRDLCTTPPSFQGSGAGKAFGNQRGEVGPGWRFEVATQDVERRIGLGLVGTARSLVEQHPASDEIGVAACASPAPSAGSGIRSRALTCSPHFSTAFPIANLNPCQIRYSHVG